MEFYGTLRITNPKTLKKWKEDGRFQQVINEGYIFAEGCKRFRTEVCTCSKCRRLLKLKQNENNYN